MFKKKKDGKTDSAAHFFINKKGFLGFYICLSSDVWSCIILLHLQITFNFLLNISIYTHVRGHFFDMAKNQTNYT